MGRSSISYSANRCTSTTLGAVKSDGDKPSPKLRPQHGLRVYAYFPCTVRVIRAGARAAPRNPCGPLLHAVRFALGVQPFRDRIQELPGIRLLRRCVELIGVALLDNVAFAHHHHFVAHVFHYREIVRDEDETQTKFVL
jgi:hypothetical protein